MVASGDKQTQRNTTMNLENKDHQRIEASLPEHESAVSSGASADGSAPEQRGESKAITGTPRGFTRPIFVITGVALCMGLSSCVAPYDSQGGGSVTVSKPY
jgi:hypothetical protein